MNFLVTGAVGNPSAIIEYIEKMGHTAVFMQNESEALPCDYEFVQAVICNGLFLHHSIEKFTSLKYIQLTSAGFDRVPMDYVKQKEIKIFNARGVYNVPMAEFALCGVLQLYKKSRFFFENQKRHEWIKNREILQLDKKTITIVGCGNVGTECAKKFKAFDCRILGVDIYPHTDPNYEKIYPLDEIYEVLAKTDVLILTLPLTEKTYHFFDKDKLEKLKSGAVLVNIARGAVVDTNALIKALNENISGAVLDVFEEEPLSKDSPLWDMQNVIITPHNSFVGEHNAQRLEQVIFANLGEIKNG